MLTSDGINWKRQR